MEAEPIRRGITPRVVKATAVAGAVCIIAAATLIPQSGAPVESFFCLTCDELWGVDVSINVALFVPLGIALFALGTGPARIAAVCFGLSAFIEFLQWAVVPGRDPSLRDILANGTGGTVAGLVAIAVARLLRDGEPARHRIALALVLGVWWVQALVTGWAFDPAAPPAPVYYGQWAHVFPGTLPFRGKVINARLNAMGVRDDSLPETAQLRESMMREGVALEVSVDSLPASPAEAQIFGLVAGPIRIIGLQVVPRGLLFQSRSRSSRLGLMRPGMLVTLPGSRVPGDIVIRATHVRSRLSVELLAGNERIQANSWALSATQGWALLIPRFAPSSWLPLLQLAWIFGFSFPAGLLACGATPGALRGQALVLAGMLLPLLIAAAVFHCAFPTPIDLLGVAAGCLAALWTRHLVPAYQRSGTSATKRS